MGLKKVLEIEQAIGTLTPQELGELYARLDRRESPLDAQISADLASGALDEAIQQALADERDGRAQPLLWYIRPRRAFGANSEIYRS